MRRASIVSSMLLGLLAAGCAVGPPYIDQMQPEALSMATRRGQFEMNCPAATATVLSRDTIQPIVFGGPLRAEYTIGVAGCGRRASYIVICPQNQMSCFAGGARTEVY
jgi:hypothetical protein